MELTVTDKAMKFFTEEMKLQAGQAVRFTSRAYGQTQVHEGLSVAVFVEQPSDPLVSIEKEGITFYIEKADEWFFHGYDFNVDYEPETEALVFNFIGDKPVDGVSGASKGAE